MATQWQQKVELALGMALPVRPTGYRLFAGVSIEPIYYGFTYDIYGRRLHPGRAEEPKVDTNFIGWRFVQTPALARYGSTSSTIQFDSAYRTILSRGDLLNDQLVAEVYIDGTAWSCTSKLYVTIRRGNVSRLQELLDTIFAVRFSNTSIGQGYTEVDTELRATSRYNLYEFKTYRRGGVWGYIPEWQRSPFRFEGQDFAEFLRRRHEHGIRNVTENPGEAFEPGAGPDFYFNIPSITEAFWATHEAQTRLFRESINNFGVVADA